MRELELFHSSCLDCSKKVTNNYSTSFSLGIKLINKDYRWAIYAIYGMVRFADEIVDTFHHCNKEELLADFKSETYKAIQNGISLNPILHSFQKAANTFHISEDLIEPFFESMAMDIDNSTYNQNKYNEYIFGSAEVVGLMCLKVFVGGNQNLYNQLKPAARSLGAAFQKVNFLRDIRSDFEERGRVYFPNVNFNSFEDVIKKEIIADIREDFRKAYEGIVVLPTGSKFGVYTAYVYYLKLLEKIERSPAKEILHKRIRIPDSEKVALLFKTYLKFKTNVF